MVASDKAIQTKVISGLNLKPALLYPPTALEVPLLIQDLKNLDVVAEAAGFKAAHAGSFGFERDTSKAFMYRDGLAYIPITGMLINRFPYSIGWLTGYEAIHYQLNEALSDDDVKGIVFDVNSGGGFVAGCFELSDVIYASRELKPSMALVNTSSYSAAFALASAASKVVVTPSAGTGSVGVLLSHYNIKKMMEDFGVEVTLLHSGEHKVDGNPYESLPDSVKKNLQASLDKTREKFVKTVARNLGLDEKVVYDTEAQVYDADESVARGFAHSIHTVEDALISFHAKSNGSTPPLEKTMSATIETKTYSQAEYDAAVAEAKATGIEAGKAEGRAEGATLERARIKGIVGHADAAGRESLAHNLAFETALDAESAAKTLASAPKQEKANPFQAAMDNTDNPDVLADGGDKADEPSVAARIAGAQDLAQGTDNASRIAKK